jgi:short-subunit dehydrogenase
MPGRRAIVTGASKGIGRAIATLLGQRGYAVALVARSQDLLDGLAEELSRQSNAAPALALAADLRDVGNAPRLVEAAAAGLGGLDLLVNCAGATKRGDFFALSHEDFLDGFALKFHGAVAMTRAAWPRLRESGAGHVVNIIGAAARTPSADFTIGGAVNSALENFTKAMADRGRPRRCGLALQLHPLRHAGRADPQRRRDRPRRLARLVPGHSPPVAVRQAGLEPLSGGVGQVERRRRLAAPTPAA